MSESELREKLAVFTATVTEWMSSTTEYRKNLCEKIDEIMRILSNLPCKERKGWYQSMNKQIAWMWGILSAVVIVILIDYFKHGRP